MINILSRNAYNKIFWRPLKLCENDKDKVDKVIKLVGRVKVSSKYTAALPGSTAERWLTIG